VRKVWSGRFHRRRHTIPLKRLLIPAWSRIN